jgi:hypothetical protein
MKPILNKWQFDLSFDKDYSRMEQGWKKFQLAIINLHTMPEKGQIISKHFYKGFIFSFRIWLPIEDIRIN